MYESFYGLARKPFELTPDVSFFYDSSAHRRALAVLSYAQQKAEGFTLLTGCSGTGKTLLLEHFLNTLDAQTPVLIGKVVCTRIDTDGILKLIAGAFGIQSKSSSRADLLLALEAAWVSAVAEGKKVFLLIDEAQSLTAEVLETLRQLTNLQIEAQPLIAIVLIGQPSLQERLQEHEQKLLHQRIIAVGHLDPMSAADTIAYVEHRLKLVGWRNDPALDESAFAAIFTLTSGVARAVNLLCDRLLLSAFLAEEHTITRVQIEALASEMRQEGLLEICK